MWLDESIKEINEAAEEALDYQGLDVLFDIAEWCDIVTDKAEEAGDTRRYNDHLKIYQKAYAGICAAGCVAQKAFALYGYKFETEGVKDFYGSIEAARVALIKDAKLTDAAGL